MNRSLAWSCVAFLLVAVAVLSLKLVTSSDKTRQKSKIAPVSSQSDQFESADGVVPHMVRQLVDPSLHFEEQIQAVRQLPDELTEGEFEALMKLLRQPNPQRVSQSRWYALQNEIMEVLGQPRFTWPRYCQHLSELLVDRHVDPVVRDYAAQHLALYLARPRIDGEEFDRGMSAFLQVFQGEREAYEQVTGTSLLALSDLSNRCDQENLQPFLSHLNEAVQELVSGDRLSSLSNQVSAIQAAGRMGFSDCLPAIRKLAANSESHSSLRLSAIAALGYFASSEDHTLLEDIAQSSSSLRFAARTALSRLPN